MKKILSILTCAFILSASAVFSADKVTIQLKWVTQAQFAGYYVAKDKGFYDAEGLDVTIKPGGPDIAPAQVLAGGGADVMVDWMPSALAARVWFYGKEYPFLSWMSRLGLKTDGSANGVTVLKQGWGVEPLTEGQAACVSTMSYNEYWVVRDAGYSPEQLTVFKYQTEGAATLEDGLYVHEKNMSDAAFKDKMVRFVRASMKGWKYAEANPKEAAMIILDNDDAGVQTEKHQVRMMGEIAKLTAGSNGSLDPADYERTVQVLMSGDSDPVITKKPSGAWTNEITNAALK